MSVPWINGTVEAVTADLRRSLEQNPNCPGVEYAAAIGMVNGLARGYGEHRSLEARMADIVTVCEALQQLNDEL
jgi:hypothetical protein